MPELPEVEFTARRLRAWLVGRPIVGARALPGSPLRDLSPAALSAGLVGRRVSAVERRGKQLLWTLCDAQVVLVHLGMTGKFVRRSLHEPARRGTRVELALAHHHVDLVDPRRFGRVRLLPSAQAAERHPEVARLGPDALLLAATPAAFARRLASTRRAIKVALMDQSMLAGVGNIYAAEALYRARVDPFAPASQVAPSAMRRLAGALRAVMEESLRRETADEIHYLDGSPAGRAANPFEIYGRAGARCAHTGAPVERVVQSGRATFWVPAWQAGRGLRRPQTGAAATASTASST